MWRKNLLIIHFYDIEKVLKNKQALSNEPLVSADSGIVQPFILHRQKLYLQRYFNYETQILRRLKSFTENEKLHLEERVDALNKNSGIYTIII